MDTKLLRQKILDLAIHGKLVPQNPADEPASVLLERDKTSLDNTWIKQIDENADMTLSVMMANIKDKN